MPELLRLALNMVRDERAKLAEVAEEFAEPDVPVLRLNTPEDERWGVHRDGDVFVVTGAKIERFARRTDFGNEATVERLRDVMRRMGITHALVRAGIEPGQTIAIAGHRFEY